MSTSTFIPLGASEPLPLLPMDDEIVLTDEDGRRAARLWNRLMPEAAGLLDAKVIIEAAHYADVAG